MNLKSLYKKLKETTFRNKKRDGEIKSRGIVIYKTYDNFSFHQYFILTAESKIFEYLMMTIIIANTFCCTISTEYETKNNGEDIDLLKVFEIFFVTTYTVEFFIKIVAHPLKFWFNLWNDFDFIILIISYLPYLGNLANFSFLRVIRAIRLLRLIRSFDSLNELLGSIGKTFSSSMILIFMLCQFILMISITAFYLFGEKVEDPWGNLATCILNIFAFATADSWSSYQDDLDEAFGEVSRIFSVLVIIFLGIIFSQGLVVASVTDGFSESATELRKKESHRLMSRNKKYSNKVKAEEQKVKIKHFIKAKEDSLKFQNFLTDDEINHLKEKGNIDTQKNIFENPKFLISLNLILLEIKRDNAKKKKLYNEMFRKMLEMSDATKSPYYINAYSKNEDIKT